MQIFKVKHYFKVGDHTHMLADCFTSVSDFQEHVLKVLNTYKHISFIEYCTANNQMKFTIMLNQQDIMNIKIDPKYHSLVRKIIGEAQTHNTKILNF